MKQLSTKERIRTEALHLFAQYGYDAISVAQIAKAVGEEVEVKYVLDLRDFSKLSYADKFVTDFSVIENDPEVCVVAEVMGGVGAAYEFSKRCLKAGKSVCTSNKELVAVHGEELLALAKEHNVNYLFEASVGGGIPLIRPMMQCLAANQIEEICGILNGTTNYILSQMIHNSVAFDDALRQAQKMGYAENDPTADIEGHDACRKICILSDLAFGDKIDPDEVSCQGISGITLGDVAAASELGYVIKLIGRAKRTESGKIFAFVAPHLVPKTSPLACVEDVFNGILVTGNMVGEVMFYGQGAGKHATASAVVADMMDAIAHREKRRPVEWGDGSRKLLLPIDQLESAWYVRGEVPAELAAKTVAGAALTVPMTAAELREKLPQAEGAMRVL